MTKYYLPNELCHMRAQTVAYDCNMTVRVAAVALGFKSVFFWLRLLVAIIFSSFFRSGFVCTLECSPFM